MGDRAMGGCGRAVAIQLISLTDWRSRSIASDRLEIKQPMTVAD
jgi:hypothetical protein